VQNQLIMKKYLPLLGLLTVLAISVISFSAFRNLSRKKATHTDSLPLTPSPKDHKGRSITNTQGAVSFTSGLDNDYYFVNAAGKTGYLYLETKIGTFFNEKARRIPLNLSIVIDRSGSMEGEKMQFARESAKQLIDRLGPSDMVSVVIYDDAVDLLQAPVPVTDRQSIKNKIDGVTSRGGTNLWGGTEKGYQQVKANFKQGYINRVLLISDGLANAGLTDPMLIKAKVQQFKDADGITLSSFGVGLDYNEVLMTDMAETGSGNYYFISNAASMASMFEKELNGMMKVAAQNAELRIKIPQGLTIQKVFALKHEQKGDEVVIKFRDLFSEETKGVLMQFAIADNSHDPFRIVSTLHYDDVADSRPKTITNENLLQPAQDNEQYLVYFNEKVLQQKVLYIANENMEKAMAEADKGNYENARSIMGSNASFLRSNESYVSSSDELQRMDSTSRNYSAALTRAETMSTDSVKHMQKANRADNYKVRTKKQ
jgi:Ca-activated chloride channel family protein